jgi:membrane-bound lytic murein transglycosylase MltF
MNHILILIQMYSSLYGMDPLLVQAIVKKESHYNPAIIGAAGEVGLMQLLPSTVGLPGKALLDPETNIREGVKYLSLMRQRCKWKENNEFIVCFNLGEGGGAKVKHPEQWSYYREVMRIYNEQRNFTE